MGSGSPVAHGEHGIEGLPLVPQAQADQVLLVVRNPMRFNVMTFGGFVQRWKKTPVEASFRFVHGEVRIRTEAHDD